MYFIIYRITNLINGKIYIGCHRTKDLEDGYVGSGTILKRSIKKHGVKNFQKDILHCCSSAEEMFETETLLVNEEFVTRTDTYNLKKGGAGGFDYVYSHPNYKEWVKKGRLITNKILEEKFGKGWKTLIGKRGATAANTPEIQIKRVETTRKRYGDKAFQTFKGKKHTEKTKDLMSKSHKGKSIGSANSQYGTMWITNGIENRKIKTVDNIPDSWYKGRVIKMAL
jgi:hypothetical protein